MIPDNYYFLYCAIVCMYNKLYKTDNYKLWSPYETALQQVNCLDVVKTALTRCNEKTVEKAVEQILQSSDIDRATCEKIKTSRGMRRIFLGEFHDAGVADVQTANSAQTDTCNLILTLNLNECQSIDNVSYRKVAKITFENVVSCSCDSTNLMGLYIASHCVKIVNEKIFYSIVLCKSDIATESTCLSLYCDDIKIEYTLVED